MKAEAEQFEVIETPASNHLSDGPEVSHTVLLTASLVCRRLLRLIFVLVVARILGPEQFGMYALLLALVEMIALASGSGFLDLLTREAAKDDGLGWGLCGQLTLLRLAYLVPIIGAGIGILKLLGYSPLVLAASACMFSALIPRAVSEAVQGVLRGLGRYGKFLVIELVLGCTLLVGACVLFLRSSGIATVVVIELMAATVAAIVAALCAAPFRAMHRFWLSWSELFRRSLVFNLYPLVGSFYNRIDVVVLSKLAGNYATGIYSTAYRAIELFQLVPSAVLYSLLPGLSRQGMAGVGRQRLERAMGLLLSVALTTVMATIVLSGPIVHLLLGDRYIESVSAVKILIGAIILMYINFALNIGLLATGHEKVFLATSSVSFTVNLFANLVFVPMFSWRAAAVITIATELVLFLQNTYWIRRAIGSVPIPFGAFRTSCVFFVLLFVAIAGERSAFPHLVGSACILAFLGYLYWSGMAAEFAGVWRTSTGPLTQEVYR